MATSLSGCTKDEGGMSNSILKIRPLSDNASMSSRIYDRLRAAIADIGIYDDHVDLRLDERELANQFQTSRTPLREALGRLQQDGLVTIIPRRGTYIVRKTKCEILEMITVWAALESMAARLACVAATDSDIAELSDLADIYDSVRVQKYMADYSDNNIRFHQSIIKLSNLELISQITDGLFMHVRAIRRRTIFEKDRALRSIQDHRDIVKALVKRDADRASKLVREHTMKLHEHVRQHVELD